MGRMTLIFMEHVLYPLAFMLGASGLYFSLKIGDTVACASSLVFIGFFALLKYLQIYTDKSRMRIIENELLLEGLSSQYSIPASTITSVYVVNPRAIMIKVQGSNRMFLLEYEPDGKLAAWLKKHGVRFKWGTAQG